jgi:hypothetical protein
VLIITMLFGLRTRATSRFYRIEVCRLKGQERVKIDTANPSFSVISPLRSIRRSNTVPTHELAKTCDIVDAIALFSPLTGSLFKPTSKLRFATRKSRDFQVSVQEPHPILQRNLWQRHTIQLN